jgi:hypothetical protein
MRKRVAKTDIDRVATNVAKEFEEDNKRNSRKYLAAQNNARLTNTARPNVRNDGERTPKITIVDGPSTVKEQSTLKQAASEPRQ